MSLNYLSAQGLDHCRSLGDSPDNDTESYPPGFYCLPYKALYIPLFIELQGSVSALKIIDENFEFWEESFLWNLELKTKIFLFDMSPPLLLSRPSPTFPSLSYFLVPLLFSDGDGDFLVALFLFISPISKCLIAAMYHHKSCTQPRDRPSAHL